MLVIHTQGRYSDPSSPNVLTGWNTTFWSYPTMTRICFSLPLALREGRFLLNKCVNLRYIWDGKLKIFRDKKSLFFVSFPYIYSKSLIQMIS